MWEAVARTPRRSQLGLGLAAAVALLSGCAGSADELAAIDLSGPPSASESATASAASSPSSTPTPEKPTEPPFRASRDGTRAFVAHVVEGWGYALQTNDPSVLLDASGREPCRGCEELRRELEQRDQEGWYVRFPGAEVREVTFRADGPVTVASATVDIPASQSVFDDGTFRNDNAARRGRQFLVHIRPDGQGERRRWTLLAFSLR